MIRRLLWIAGALLLVLGLGVTLLLYTGWGLQQALRLADRFAPVDLEFESARGHLADAFSVQGLVISDAGWRLTVDRLAVQWGPAALMDRQLVIDDLDAGNVELILRDDGKPPSEPSEPPALDFGWNISLRSASVDRLVLRSAGEPVVATRLDTAAELTDGTLSITRAALDYDTYRATLSGRVESTRNYTHDLTLTVERDGQLARITAKGDLHRTSFAVRSAPYGLDAEGELQQLLTDLRWTLESEIAQPGPWPDLQSASLSAEGSLTQASAELRGQYADTPFRVSGAQLSWDGPIRVSATQVVLPDQELTATVTGQLLDDDRISADVEFEMTPQSHRLTGELSLTGTLDRYTAAGSGLLDERVHWSIDANGDQQGLEAFQAKLSEGTAGTALLTGSVSWSPSLQWQTRIQADRLNPARIWPEWPGAIDVDGEARGTDQSAELVLSELSGRLRDHPIHGRASVTVVTGGIRDLEMSLTSGDSEIDASGDWTTESKQLNAEFQVADLGDFLPSAAGRLQGRIDAAGGALSLDVSGTALAYADDYRATTLRAGGRIALEPSEATDLTLNGAGLVFRGLDIDDAAVSLRGPADALDVSVSAEVQRLGTLDGHLTAAITDRAYELQFTQLSVTSEEYGSWALADPTRVYFDPESLMIERSCLQSATGTLCGAADLKQANPGRMVIDLDAVNASLFDLPLSAAAGEPIRLGGRIDGTVDVQSDGFDISRFDSRITGQRLSVLLLRRAPDDALLFRDFQLTAEGDGQRIDARMTLAAEGADLQASLSVLDAVGGNPVIADGELRLEVPALSRFDPIVGRMSDLDGRLAATAEFAGPLAAPVVEGRLQVEALTFHWPEYGTAIQDGVLTVALDSGGALSVSATLPTAGGALGVQGDGQLDGFAIRRLTATIKGQNVVMADAPDLEIRASPDLTLTATRDELRLRGEVRIDRADIERALANAVVRPSSDVVLVGAEREVEEGALQPVDIEIQIVLSDEVRFRGFGLDAEIDGRITIIDRPEERQRARGELLLSGSYKAYGQQLTIENGRLIYSGTPLDNPGIRLEAYRQVDNVRAGVRVTGRAANPVIELYSDPAMSDSNILAYMMLGRPLDQATEGESNYLSNAALVLAMRQGSDTTAAIGEQLGFEQFGLTMQEDLGGAAFAVGRYLAPNLYLRYSIGLLNPIDLIELTYELNDRWSLETEIGLETRGGIRYRIERGRPAPRQPKDDKEEPRAPD